MEVKPTFFSLAGFLTPGVVLLAALFVLEGHHQFGSTTKALAALPTLSMESGWAIVIGTALATSLLAVAFVLGAVLSDGFIFLGRKLIVRPLMRRSLRSNVNRVFAHQTLEALLRADMDARESYVYMRTCGIDLHWYAGRVRMMGGTGLALLFIAIYTRVLCYGWPLSIAITAIAVTMIVVALYRSSKFDQYVSAASAVLVRLGSDSALPDQSASETSAI
jgi:hypothetical protein